MQLLPYIRSYVLVETRDRGDSQVPTTKVGKTMLQRELSHVSHQRQLLNGRRCDNEFAHEVCVVCGGSDDSDALASLGVLNVRR